MRPDRYGDRPPARGDRYTLRDNRLFPSHVAFDTLTPEAQRAALLAAEGSVLIAANGSAIGNPRQRAVDALNRMILASRRTLSLTARAKAGNDNRVLGQRRAIQKGNEAVLDDIDDEGLLARPGAIPTNPKRRH